MNLQDKVIAVTGAGGGIGAEIVKALIAQGARVLALDIKAESMQKLVSNGESSLVTWAVDITDRTAVEALPDQAIKQLGQIDGIINCAGVIQPFVKINDLDYDAIERVMNINFYGTLYMVKAFLPHLLDRPEACVVNVSSMGGFLPVPGQGVYGASKAAVKLLTEALYAELMGTNVHVSVVFPGGTQTDITKNSGVTMKSLSPEDAKKVPMLSPAAVADLIVRGIQKNQPQIYTGKDSRSMNLLYRLAPVFATKFIAKKMGALLG